MNNKSLTIHQQANYADLMLNKTASTDSDLYTCYVNDSAVNVKLTIQIIVERNFRFNNFSETSLDF